MPIGSNAGAPNDREMQMGILKDSLQCIVEFDHFGMTKMLPYTYSHR